MMLVSAETTTYTIDNDDAHGYSNDSVGFSNYLTGSTLYNSDARTQKGTDNSYYQWTNPYYLKYANIKLTLSVYLYHDYFTDSAASYHVQRNTSTNVIIGEINQRYAPAGWSVLSATLKPVNANGANYIRSIQVYPSKKQQRISQVLMQSV